MRVETSGIRLSVLGVTVLALFAALFARLWFLQVAASPGLEQRVASNRIKTVPLLPTRGRIYDRTGRTLADNKRRLVVVADQSKLRGDKARALAFTRLAGALQTQPEVFEERYQSKKYNRLLPLPLAEDVTEVVAGYLAERVDDYPGISVEVQSARVYRYSPIASQIVGYTGQIQAETVKEYQVKGYALDELVGVAGAEKGFEDVLRGKPGSETVEIDSATNKRIRVISRVEPEPGADVQLAIDLKVQQYAEQIVAAELQARRLEAPPVQQRIDGTIVRVPDKFKAPVGSAVVEDANTGEIIAMASYPTYDNRWFDGSTPPAKLESLFGLETLPDGTKKPRFDGPLFNRAVSGTYQIGSTMKLFTSLAAMRYDRFDKDGHLVGKVLNDPNAKYFDIGTWTLPADQCSSDEPAGCTKKNAGKTQYGPVNLAEAIAVSSDAYFYELGAQLWISTGKGTNALQTELRSFGFGRRLGTDLPGEQTGLVPDAEVKKELARQHIINKFDGSKYFTGDNVNLGIGQGLFGATPLQLVNGYGAFANGGSVFRPLIGRGIWEPGAIDSESGKVDFRKMTLRTSIDPQVISTVDLTPEMVTPVKEGLHLVVQRFQVPGVPGAGNPQRSTAFHVFAGYDHTGYPIFGKTGTAQTGDQKDEKDTSLFVAFGGLAGQAPQYSIGAVIEQAGFGAGAAAPVVRCLFEAMRNPDTLPEPTQSLPLDKVRQFYPAILPTITPEGRFCIDNIEPSTSRNVVD
jgi:penicillin-binding protein 2